MADYCWAKRFQTTICIARRLPVRSPFFRNTVLLPYNFNGWNSIFAEKESKVSCLRREGRIWSRLHVDHDLRGKILYVSRSYVSFFDRSIKREKERKMERGRESFLLNSNFESVVDTIRFRIGQIQTLNVTWTKK